MQYTMMSKQWREDIILSALYYLLDRKPKRTAQIRYRINRYAGTKSYLLDEYLKDLNLTGCIVLIGNNYRITDKGIEAYNKLKALLDMWK